MSWTYMPRTAGARIRHDAGTVPPRPLEVGDVIRSDGAREACVIAVADNSALVQLEDTLGCRRVAFRDPLEGDYSRCIGEVTR